jgi:FKBP-type peptidyl-prolyl cis-trans isomerase FkpA
MRITAVLVLALALGACGSPAAPDDRWESPERISYAPALGVDLAQMEKSPSGLYWADLTVGTGAAAGVGRTVRTLHRGWLPDGTPVYQVPTLLPASYPHSPADTLNFRLGLGFMIRGWDEGIVGMQVGGRRRLVVPPALAYGRPGRGPVPPLATLVFDVELVGVSQ